MGENSDIQWTDHTFNPWSGCTKVSPGCAHCYAESLSKRNGSTFGQWGKGAPRRRTSESNWNLPVKWNREAEKDGVRRRVFCASLADWLDDEVPVEWLADLLNLVRKTPHLDWLLLTKRPENFRSRLGSIKTSDEEFAAWLLAWMLGEGEFKGGQFDGLEGPGAPANVWLGTSVENQEMADKRIRLLISIPARVRFLSCEPLLGPVEIAWANDPIGYVSCGGDAPCSCKGCAEVRYWPRDDDGEFAGIHWVIAGGESGPGARPMDEAWARQLRDDCAETGAAFFMKQLGGVRDKRGDLDQLPEDLRIRKWPTPRTKSSYSFEDLPDSP